MSVLVLNAGSSTLKCALFDQQGQSELASAVVDWQGGSQSASVSLQRAGAPASAIKVAVANVGQAVEWVHQAFDQQGVSEPIRVVGHRVVHGGTEFVRPTLIDDAAFGALERCSKLAPLHNPPALRAVAAAKLALPEIPQVAVFDTAFFATLPLASIVYPVPYAWFEQFGIRRFGFHGISHAYCASRAAELLGRAGDSQVRLVICHLGNGCSATAVRGGEPRATTMGFTPLEGLMMGTRSGSIDPGILLHLLQEHGWAPQQLFESLNRQAGLLGVSGVSSDFREVERVAAAGEQRAQLALDMFVDRVRGAVGALAVSLGGVDALVFTGGIGQHSAWLRGQVCMGLECLGLTLDVEANQKGEADCDLATSASVGRILIIRTREEQAIARAAYDWLQNDSLQ